MTRFWLTSFLLFLAFLAGRAEAFEAEFHNADEPGPSYVRMELPVFQAPFNLISGGFPSMQQSLHITKDLYNLGHLGIKKSFGSSGLRWRQAGVRGFTLAFDLLASSLPGFDAWVHEEWHRAVMRRRGIDSYNGVYDLDIGASVIPVRKVKDADLIALKRDHPLDMIRLPAAGVEGQLELVTAMQKEAFFYDTHLHQSYFYILSYLGVIYYIESGGNSTVNDMHEELEDKESDPDDRDFVGHDFNSWVYDLFRPQEPYEDRGPHASGNGIRRYRDTSDLSENEIDYMNLQGKLVFLNLLDPFTASINRMRFNDQSSFNVSIRHQLTSFGYVIDKNIFYRADPLKLFVRLHSYFNYKNYFPGFDAEILDYPMPMISQYTTVGLRVGGWLQPKNQAFKTHTGEVGGLLGVKVGQNLAENLQVYIDLLGKTDGWVAGNEYLERTLSSAVGVIQTL